MALSSCLPQRRQPGLTL